MIEINKISGSGIFQNGFENNPTFFVAWEKREIVGYLEYCRSWDNDKDIYISSLQILPGYRGGAVLLAILGYARKVLLNEEFNKIVSGVQKNNVQAIRLYQKLGFSIVDNPANDKSLIVSATKDILDRESILRLMDRHNNRMQRTPLCAVGDA